MNALELFTAIEKSDEQIKAITEQLKRFCDLQEAPVSSKSLGIMSKGENRLETTTENKIKYEDMLKSEIEYWQSLRVKCEELLKQIDTRQALVLRHRYVLGKKWKDVALATHYEERTCRRLAGQGIVSVDRILSENVRDC